MCEARNCTNCYENKVDESKQGFIYRDWQGNKWLSALYPICDQCINEGTYKIEKKEYQDGIKEIKRLYLGPKRSYKG